MTVSQEANCTWNWRRRHSWFTSSFKKCRSRTYTRGQCRVLFRLKIHKVGEEFSSTNWVKWIIIWSFFGTNQTALFRANTPSKNSIYTGFRVHSSTKKPSRIPLQKSVVDCVFWREICSVKVGKSVPFVVDLIVINAMLNSTLGWINMGKIKISFENKKGWTNW